MSTARTTQDTMTSAPPPQHRAFDLAAELADTMDAATITALATPTPNPDLWDAAYGSAYLTTERRARTAGVNGGDVMVYLRMLAPFAGHARSLAAHLAPGERVRNIQTAARYGLEAGVAVEAAAAGTLRVVTAISCSAA